jgi:hypothetical protein
MPREKNDYRNQKDCRRIERQEDRAYRCEENYQQPREPRTVRGPSREALSNDPESPASAANSVTTSSTAPSIAVRTGRLVRVFARGIGLWEADSGCSSNSACSDRNSQPECSSADAGYWLRMVLAEGP